MPGDSLSKALKYGLNRERVLSFYLINPDITLDNNHRKRRCESFAYLTDVLQRVAVHPMSRVNELKPTNWQRLFGDNPMRSDLHAAGRQ